MQRRPPTGRGTSVARNEPPADARWRGQVVVLVDDRSCSLAALAAAACSAAAGTRIAVIYQARRPPVSGYAAIPAVVTPGEDPTTDTFFDAAALLAPFGLSWDFLSAGPGPVRASWGLASAAAVFAARHQAGHLRGVVLRRSAARIPRGLRAAGDRVVLVSCDRDSSPTPERT
jgi:hypothetical protein